MGTRRTGHSLSRFQAWQRYSLLVISLTQQSFVPGPLPGVQGGTAFSSPFLFCPSTSRKPTKLASLEAFNKLGRAVAKALPLLPLVKHHKNVNEQALRKSYPDPEYLPNFPAEELSGGFLQLPPDLSTQLEV